MNKEVTLWADVIAERRQSNHPWADVTWRPVALRPCQGAEEESPNVQRTESGDGWDRFLIGRLPIHLHHKETEAYRENLAAARPAIYVVLDPNESGDMARPKRATASPFEAQDYLDAGEDIIEALPIPEALHALIEAFVAEHHKAQAFKKRKRVNFRDETPLFGKELHPVEARFYKQQGTKRPK